MLDQNLLDKQFILEQLIDLLEKSHIIRTQSNTINENSAVKLLLNTSKFKFCKPYFWFLF